MQSPIDAYLEGLEPGVRAELKRVRSVALSVVPGADETIGYKMPTLRYRGVAFLGFAARKKHIGIYPYSGRVIEALAHLLAGYDTSRGAVRVPLDAPMPAETLRAIVECRLSEIDAAAR